MTDLLGWSIVFIRNEEFSNRLLIEKKNIRALLKFKTQHYSNVAVRTLTKMRFSFSIRGSDDEGEGNDCNHCSHYRTTFSLCHRERLNNRAATFSDKLQN